MHKHARASYQILEEQSDFQLDPIVDYTRRTINSNLQTCSGSTGENELPRFFVYVNIRKPKI